MDYRPGEFKPVPEVGGMKPWACSYDGPDGRYCITLYGTDPEQVLEDNCDGLPGLKVDGQLVSVAKAFPTEDD